MKPLLHTIDFLCMVALGFAWHVSGIGMSEEVTTIGYIVLILVAFAVFDEIEEWAENVN